ncbi:SRPBCC domain-containing protein [Streptomyces sp. NPDC047017]|uniref:SRPBCC domain-containing protein n=1 Tax=Streptomyces sp. NPDC047017 TaxID=3155024 RepID=UPI0034048766
MTGSIAQGTSQTHGNTHILHFLVRLARPMEAVWPALTTPQGLARWFTPADELEPRLGGAVSLRGLGSGQITAWDVDRVAEYTLGTGRVRFHLERDGEDGCALRFTHEFSGEAEPASEPAAQPASERAWRARFERLIEQL